jgi:hypothetical protein
VRKRPSKGQHAVAIMTQPISLHETLYSKWHLPDNPSVSCRNEAACYPTEIRYIGGDIYVKRRRKYIPIPPQKVEQKTANPEGRNHLSPDLTSIGHGVSRWEARHEITWRISANRRLEGFTSLSPALVGSPQVCPLSCCHATR